MLLLASPVLHLSRISFQGMTEILYRQYIGEPDLPHIMSLVQSELSEPYVIYTYRYFLHQWCARSVPSPRCSLMDCFPLCRPQLTFLVRP